MFPRRAEVDDLVVSVALRGMDHLLLIHGRDDHGPLETSLYLLEHLPDAFSVMQSWIQVGALKFNSYWPILAAIWLALIC
jgi:hypothetical protein